MDGTEQSLSNGEIDKIAKGIECGHFALLTTATVEQPDAAERHSLNQPQRYSF